MSIEYVMPKLAMAMNEGTIAQWLVASGQRVERGQLLATVETEKVAYDLESPEDGIFMITVATGETVPVESPIGLFFETQADFANHPGNAAESIREDSSEEAISSDAKDSLGGVVDGSSPSGARNGRIKASPLARKLSDAHDINLRDLNGTGPGGRIVKRDIQAALERRESTSQRSSNVGTMLPEGGGATLAINAPEELARIPFSGMRGAIAQRMLSSTQSTAQLSLNWNSDVTDLIQLRERFVARREQLGTKVSVNAFIAKAISTAVRAVPIANSCVQNDEVVIYKAVNMGFAISLPGSTAFDSGLAVGVIRGIDTMGVVDIDKAMKAVAERVRDGTASPEDLSGSTITLSSTAFIGPPGLVTTPILNTPNSTLVGTSTPMRQPRERDGEFVGRTIMPLSLTFDHCAYDGELAALFAAALHDCLESPELMLA